MAFKELFFGRGRKESGPELLPPNQELPVVIPGKPAVSPESKIPAAEKIEIRDLRINVFVRLKNILTTPIEQVLRQRYAKEIKEKPAEFLPQKLDESLNKINSTLEDWQTTDPRKLEIRQRNLNALEEANKTVEGIKQFTAKRLGPTTIRDLDRRIRVLELAQKRVGPLAWLRQSSGAQKEALAIAKNEYKIQPRDIAKIYWKLNAKCSY